MKQIAENLAKLIGSVGAANQADWNEADSTKASFIKNKPDAPVLVVEGTVSDSAFTAGSGQPTLTEAAAAMLAGKPVYLKYESSDEVIVELATYCNDDTPSIATKNLTWS